jgi:alkanesulfonate monooxygenase SsuD/methylene tetrahydromethanopterin reductase-like flavin-dependent oxidoreductase (luciferase family)
MKFAIRLPRTGPFASSDSIIQVAKLAEELRFDSVTGNDTVAFGLNHRYHFSAGTVEAVDRLEKVERPTNCYETMVMLSFVAGMTKRIRLIPVCFVLPWRNPIMIAKQYATLQELSKGRAVFALGIGNVEEDFQNFNVPFNRRGAITDEYLQALKAILSDEPVTRFEGKYIRFSGEFYPKPKKASFLIAGGFLDASLRRVAKYADGWIPVGTPEQFEVGLGKIRKLQVTYGHQVPLEVGPQVWICVAKTSDEAWNRANLTVKTYCGLREMVRQLKSDFTQTNLIGSLEDVSNRLEEYQKAGVNFVELKFIANDLNEMCEEMKLVASNIAPRFK